MKQASKILIVEDEGLIAFDLGSIVYEQTGLYAVLADTVREARCAVKSNRIVFALLDADVTDGNTFEFARELRARSIPFIFTSAIRSQDVPWDLRDIPFLGKPCPYRELTNLLSKFASRQDNEMQSAAA